METPDCIKNLPGVQIEEMSATIKELATALSKAQGKMRHAIKDSNNPFFRSKYADLASVVDASRAALVENGLSVVQYTKGNYLYTMLLHSSGEWIRGYIELKPMRQVKDTGWAASEDPQSYGSCITYARRYAMAAITGVATEDDDGNAASGNTAPVDAPPQVNLDPEILGTLANAKTLDELQAAWNKIPVGVRHGYASAKDASKTRIGKQAA
jgi:hypothetical protein